MAKARVLSNIVADGTRYARGDVFEGDDATVAKLVAAGALQDPDAPVDVATQSVDSQAEADKIVADAAELAKSDSSDGKSDSDTSSDSKKAAKK